MIKTYNPEPKTSSMRKKLAFLLKGFSALFAIKAIFVGGMLLLTACTKDHSSPDATDAIQRQAVKNFEAVAKANWTVMQRIAHNHLNNFGNPTTAFAPRPAPATAPLNTMKLADGPEVPTDPNQVVTPPSTTDVTLDEINAMQPILQASIAVVEAYGLKDALQAQFDNDPQSPNFITAAVAISIVEEAHAAGYDPNDPNNGGGNVSFFMTHMLSNGAVYASMPTWINCILVAVGIDAFAALISKGIRRAIIDLGVSGVARMLGEFVAEHVGWWGAIVAVYEYTRCMTHPDDYN